MQHEAIRELFDYWNGLRGTRAAPERADIDLAAIRGLIANVFMLDPDMARRFPFVLSGTRVNALACGEVKGRPFLDLWAPDDRGALAAMLLTVIDAACPFTATAIASLQGFNDYRIDMLFLPLGQRGDHRARILGMTAPAKPPSWLGLLPAKNLTLRSLDTLEADLPPIHFDMRHLFVAPAASPASEQASEPGRRIRHLKVFEGGRPWR